VGDHVNNKENTMKIEGTQFDRRRKLSIAQRDEIKRLFDSGKWNKTSLAEKFGVTVNAIRFIVDPEMYKKWKENRDGRRKLHCPDRP
jgi:hypothetical protein